MLALTAMKWYTIEMDIDSDPALKHEAIAPDDEMELTSDRAAYIDLMTRTALFQDALRHASVAREDRFTINKKLVVWNDKKQQPSVFPPKTEFAGNGDGTVRPKLPI